MTADWCDTLTREANYKRRKSEILKSDLWSHFTSDNFVKLVKEFESQISRIRKGRAIDNIFIERFWRTVKYEYIT